MGELSEEVKDLNNSLAFSVLDDLLKDGAITNAEADAYKTKYGKLHEFVLQTYTNKQNYLARWKQLQHRLMSERIRLEKASQESQEDQKCIQQLSDQITEIQSRQEVLHDQDTLLQIQLSEFVHERRDKQTLLEEHESARAANALPQIRDSKREIEVLQKEIEVLKQQKDASQEQLEEYDLKCNELDREMEANHAIHAMHELEYNKIKADPGRVRKQGEKFEIAVENLKEQQSTRIAEIAAAQQTVKDKTQAQREAEDRREEKHMRVKLMAKTSEHTDKSRDDVKQKLEREKNAYYDLVQKRFSLDQELDELNAESRGALAEFSLLQKQFEKQKRQHRKTQTGIDSVKESIEPLENNKRDLAKQTKQQEDDIRRQKKLLEDIQAEVDLFIGAHLKQETLEREKKEEYDSINQQMGDLQKELVRLKEEETNWVAHFKMLASHREKLAREASTAHRQSRETDYEVAMKQLEEDEYNKKYLEISQKKKQFQALYEAVKNERSRCVTKIQNRAQHLSEMKEKLKILQNEVEILRMESASKDKQLQKLRTEATRLNVAKDQLQNDKTRITTKGEFLNEQVEQYVIEIDKLNSIINSIEKEMVILRRKYEQAVETRNFTGTQLIDRNDELCILWEKANIQEKLLKKGEDAMLSRAEEIRGLRIDLHEAQRQLKVARSGLPEVPKLVEELVRLRAQVDAVRRRTDVLSRELENPRSSLRQWRKLGGEDFDPQTLRVRIGELEERLNDKKEALLEKELILEEVTALSDKLRQQAVEGRQGTMELSQKVNMFQSRIKDVTRKMMATVSELSVHQTTAHRLQRECDEACERAMTSKERFENAEPPTDTAEAEFMKLLHTEHQREMDRQASIARKQEEEVMNSLAVRTTAEPRVNAYPDEEHGLPKAYGTHAPFKPTVAGSTMRHIRKPVVRPIEF